ncbi:hypothetical protein VFPPC_16446 [Pochonia chlamydosporia 170]|uniref:Uncharacterized protein n=1 Tax=Pochonia chlamydosporia 170 TaxID=1380566 RepID=A0A179FDV5_METCM|nr:hypothetical protein VFPPC_16446 [Pochonia chlamydosporia 170]OAQ63253.1 hypothetical protein VFPPC_16446 [Pochonia chlamydosporia 170]
MSAVVWRSYRAALLFDSLPQAILGCCSAVGTCCSVLTLPDGCMHPIRLCKVCPDAQHVQSNFPCLARVFATTCDQLAGYVMPEMLTENRESHLASNVIAWGTVIDRVDKIAVIATTARLLKKGEGACQALAGYYAWLAVVEMNSGNDLCT